MFYIYFIHYNKRRYARNTGGLLSILNTKKKISSEELLTQIGITEVINGKNKYYKFTDHKKNPKYGYRLLSIDDTISNGKHEDITTEKDNNNLRDYKYKSKLKRNTSYELLKDFANTVLKSMTDTEMDLIDQANKEFRETIQDSKNILKELHELATCMTSQTNNLLKEIKQLPDIFRTITESMQKIAECLESNGKTLVDQQAMLQEIFTCCQKMLKHFNDNKPKHSEIYQFAKNFSPSFKDGCDPIFNMANTINLPSQQQVPAIHPEAISNTMDQCDADTNLDAAQDI